MSMAYMYLNDFYSHGSKVDVLTDMSNQATTHEYKSIHLAHQPFILYKMYFMKLNINVRQLRCCGYVPVYTRLPQN